MRALGRIVATVVLVLIPLGALAHPLGNFTTNQYVGVHVTSEAVVVDYVLDLAEIPASQVRRDIDADSDGVLDESEGAAYAADECRRVTEELTLTIDGSEPTLVVQERLLTFPPGEAGLSTLRLECRYDGAVPNGLGRLEIDNGNFANRFGWHEIVLTTVDVAADTTLPAESITSRLAAYPEELLSSPVDVRTAGANLAASPGSARGTPPPEVGAVESGRSSPVDALAALIDPSAGSPALPVAMVVAVGLGILHALAPGHGKTVMAAYLVGSRGTAGQAVLLGVAVAVSHTLGVLALGLVTVVGTSAFAPERVFPVLSTISGLIVIGIGAWMLVQWLRHRRRHHHDGEDHGHDHNHGHHHGPGGHTHELPDGLADQPGWRVLASMGLAGGLVPSGSAVVLLLAAVNLGRVPVGILLIALFGVGMAATLIGVGFLLLSASRFSLDRFGAGAWMARLRSVLTPVAAIVVMAVGVFLTINAS